MAFSGRKNNDWDARYTGPGYKYNVYVYYSTRLWVWRGRVKREGQRKKKEGEGGGYEGGSQDDGRRSKTTLRSSR